MTLGGETLQLSFGPAANAITSHVCNLQGLASTTSSSDHYDEDVNVQNEGQQPICDPYVTHSVQNEIYVPRVLFVDTKNHFSPWPNVDVHHEQSQTHYHHQLQPPHHWNEHVEIFHRTSSNQSPANNDVSSSSSSPFLDTNDITSFTINQLNQTQKNAFDKFQSIISSSTTGPSSIINNVHSRYHSAKYKQVSSQFIYSNSNHNERCMQWDYDDDKEEEEEEENYDDEYYNQDYKQRKLQKEQHQWNQYQYEVQSELSHAWDTFLNGSEVQKLDDIQQEQQQQQQQQEQQQQEQDQQNPKHQSPIYYLSWLHYFMPPHPFYSCYTAPLPFDQIINNNSQNNYHHHHHHQSIIYSHYYGKYPSSSSQNIVNGITDTWYNELSDKIRKWLEDCDAIKGIHLTIDNDKSIFGGIASNVLEELNDECKSAGKFSILVHDGDNFDSLQNNNNDYDVNHYNDPVTYWRSERKVVNTFRRHLNDGLNLHGVHEHSDLVLPLSLKKCWTALNNTGSKNNNQGTLFETSAVGALAVEAMTLSYRLLRGVAASSLNRNRTKVGIMTGYYQGSGQSDDVFPSVDSLSFHEFISSLRPSNSHTMLELSTCIKNFQNNELDNRLSQGTSIERRRLEEERERNRNSMNYRRSRGRDVSPGLWLEDSHNGGILHPLIPIEDKDSHRSMHRHFTMSSSFRPSHQFSFLSAKNSLSSYTTMIMEGMGIPYRPQSSVSTSVRQSLSKLTGSHSYAAGTYWSSIFKKCGSDINNVPVLTMLGNSTRVYFHLKSSSQNMSQALSRKYQGYLSRDSMAGLVPEHEDCTDALEKCLSLKDTYEPPMKFDDDEGSYFDDNLD